MSRGGSGGSTGRAGRSGHDSATSRGTSAAATPARTSAPIVGESVSSSRSAGSGDAVERALEPAHLVLGAEHDERELAQPSAEADRPVLRGELVRAGGSKS